MSEHFTPPTPADLKARYPEFASLTDARIQTVLDEAAIDVNDDWDLGSDTASLYRSPAMLALTAHLLVQEGALSDSGEAMRGEVQSTSVGDVSVTFASTAAQSGAASIYASTSYGRRFLELKRLAFPSFVHIKRA